MPPGRSEVAPERFEAWLAHRALEHPEAQVTTDGPLTVIRWDGGGAVSYTHLTLPTSDLV